MGRLPMSLLLTGPPGWGKTTVIRQVVKRWTTCASRAAVSIGEPTRQLPGHQLAHDVAGVATRVHRPRHGLLQVLRIVEGPKGAQIHIIPRYSGDRDDPRGGIRWVIPRKARYWREGDQ